MNSKANYKKTIGLFSFVLALALTLFNSSAMAAINYSTTSYCPTYTNFVVSEQETAYDLNTSSSTTLGACGVNEGMFDPKHYAAIDPGSWENGAACGACAVLNYKSNATTVQIVDECATCGSNTNHLDISYTAYGELVGSANCATPTGSGGGVNTGGCPAAPGGGSVTWHFIQCPITGSAAITFNDASGNITYAFKDSSSAGWHPITFWDTLFPIASVAVGTSSTSFTALTRDTSDSIPEFWGGTGQSNTGAPLYYKITDDRGNSVTLGPINSISPTVNGGTHVAFGTSSVQFPACVTGPTNTFTVTPIPGTPTNTPTITRTFTITPTATPISGCKSPFYNGTAPHALANAGYNANNLTLTETTGSAYAGDTNGLNLAINVPAATYYALMQLNWTKYSAGGGVISLANYSIVEFHIDNTTAAASPMTYTVALSDYTGAGSGSGPGSTQSNAVTIVVTGTGWQTFDIPTSSFMTGGASYSTTNVGEFDLQLLTSASAETATVYFDDLGFYGACATPTFTPTNSPTRTFTGTPTATLSPTLTRTITATSTPTLSLTPTLSPTVTQTLTMTSTKTATLSPTQTNSLTPTNTITQTLTRTSTMTVTDTRTPTNTFTITNTPVPGATNTFTFTVTPTLTRTATMTVTDTKTPTNTFTITNTPVPGATNTFTFTVTPTLTRTPTALPTDTFTPTSTKTGTNTATPTITLTPVFTYTQTLSPTITLSPTQTFTTTITNTPTATLTATNTFTTTLTPTPTLTATLTSTPTITKTQTFTFTQTPTNTFTFTLTPTATVTQTYTPIPAAVNVTTSSSSPSGSSQIPGASNVPVLELQATNSNSEASTLTGITLTAGGTGDSNNGVLVSVYLDSSGSGVVGSGTTLLATGVYSGGKLTLSFNQPLPAGSADKLLITYSFSGTAVPGTYQPTVMLNSDVTGKTQGSNVPIVVTGAPVVGAVIIINQPTATASPTVTATVTLTPTVTDTPIPTTFYVSMNVITSTSGPVSIHITYPEAGNYQIEIFNSTGEFIKNLKPPVSSTSNGQDLWFTWDGTNSLGQKCASGIYVIYYQQPLGVKEAKILLLR